MGASKPWPEAMKALTGQKNMDANGILEYFKPLQTWLEKENQKNGVYVGWKSAKEGILVHNVKCKMVSKYFAHSMFQEEEKGQRTQIPKTL